MSMILGQGGNRANIFMECVQSVGNDDTTLIMQCVSDTYQESQEKASENLYSFLLVVSGALIFFMQAGFAMLCAGSVR